MHAVAHLVRGSIMKLKTLVVVATCYGFLASASSLAASKPSNHEFAQPVSVVYAAVVQVATIQYSRLLHNEKDSGTVAFLKGNGSTISPYWELNVICQAVNGKTLVSVDVEKYGNNPQMFFVGHEQKKAADEFYRFLEAQLRTDEANGADSQPNVPTSPAPQPALTGSVMITSAPAGADIVVDGKFVGNAPSTLTLEAGDHKVDISSNGYQPWTRTLTVTPGSSEKLNAVLAKQQ